MKKFFVAGATFKNYLTSALIATGILIGISGSTVSLKRFMEV